MLIPHMIPTSIQYGYTDWLKVEHYYTDWNIETVENYNPQLVGYALSDCDFTLRSPSFSLDSYVDLPNDVWDSGSSKSDLATSQAPILMEHFLGLCDLLEIPNLILGRGLLDGGLTENYMGVDEYYPFNHTSFKLYNLYDLGTLPHGITPYKSYWISHVESKINHFFGDRNAVISS